MPLKLLRKRLKAYGPYLIKNTSIGWWIDGSCGFSVAGYFDSEEEAIKEAIKRIEFSICNNIQDSWRF